MSQRHERAGRGMHSPHATAQCRQVVASTDAADGGNHQCNTQHPTPEVQGAQANQLQRNAQHGVDLRPGRRAGRWAGKAWHTPRRRATPWGRHAAASSQAGVQRQAWHAEVATNGEARPVRSAALAPHSTSDKSPLHGAAFHGPALMETTCTMPHLHLPSCQRPPPPCGFRCCCSNR